MKPDELEEPERYALSKLRKRLEASAKVSADAVGEVLPEAVTLSSNDGRTLPKSMVGAVEEAIDLSVRGEPTVLATALFPIIGAAIRKAVERLVSEAMAKANAGLENTFSPRRLAWRLQSLRSGVPYYEIVLKNTLEYRVEQAFLVHKETGLLLASASRSDARLADKDMVASMLTAIRDYVADSLELKREGDVSYLAVGDYCILVEEGPLALVALIVRGAPGACVRDLAQDAVETAHLRLAAELRSFSGEVGPFEAMAPAILGPCLVSAEIGGKKGAPVYALALLGILVAAVAFFSVRGGIAAARDRAFIAALDAEPGIVVIDSRRAWGRTEARVLRDARAREVSAIASERGVDISRFSLSIEGYVSTGEFSPASGAPAAPASAAPAVPAPASTTRARAPEPAASSPSTASPAPSAALKELLGLAERLDGMSLLFQRNSALELPGQEGRIAEMRGLASAILRDATAAGLSPGIMATGHIAGSISDQAGEKLSEARAQRAVALLCEGDSSLSRAFASRGAGIAEPLASESLGGGAEKNRSVSFKVSLR